MGTLGSRWTFHMGHAVRLACEEAKAKLAALAAETGVPSGTNLPVAELFRRKYGMQAGTVIGAGSYLPSYVSPDHATGQTPNATPFWMVGGSAAEVEVDTETGQIRVLRLITVGDAGTPVNPRIVETQLTGAAPPATRCRRMSCERRAAHNPFHLERRRRRGDCAAASESC